MITLIRNKFVSPEDVARKPIRVKGGWFFTYPPKTLRRYNSYARRQAIADWTRYGASALACLIGGSPMVGGMAIQSVGFASLPGHWVGGTSTPAQQSDSLTAAGHYSGGVFKAGKTGLIRGFGIDIVTATGSPTGDFQLETVSATTGFPTGTLFATNTSKTGVSITTGWKDSGDFTADASVTKGDVFAAVLRYASGTTIAPARASVNVGGYPHPYMVRNLGSDAKVIAMPGIGLRYSDGSYAHVGPTWPFVDIVTTSFNSGTNPNHRGGVWTVSVKCRCVGAWMQSNWTQNFSAIVATDNWDGTADDDGTSNLVAAVDKDQIQSSSNAPGFFIFDSSMTFTVGAKYRAIYKPTTVSNTPFYHATLTAAAVADQCDLGQSYGLTTANNPANSGSWSDTSSRPFCGFWLDGFDDGVATGGPIGANMRGGYQN